MILLLWWLLLLLQAKWTNYVKMEIECCVCEGLQLLFLSFFAKHLNIEDYSGWYDDGFCVTRFVFCTQHLHTQFSRSSNVLGFAFFYFPYSRAQFRLYFGVYHLISISVCIWKLCVHESTMKYSMFTTIYFIFGLNDTTTTCATAIVSSVSTRDRVSERTNKPSQSILRSSVFFCIHFRYNCYNSI